MKTKISRILGVGLVVALLTSLALVPVSATVSAPTVALDDYVISHTADYTITFTLGMPLPEGDDIIIEFPAGTDITGASAAIWGTSGIGSVAFSNETATATDVGQKLLVTVPDITDLDNDGAMEPDTDEAIGAGALVQVVVYNVGNPDAIGSYTLKVSTDSETTQVTSGSYTLTAPTVPGLPGIVSVYNPNGILMAQYTGDGAIANGLTAADKDYTVKIGPGTYANDAFDVLDDNLTIMATGLAAETVITIDWVGGNDEIISDGVTITGLTFEGELYVEGEQTTIQNCVFAKTSTAWNEWLIEFDLVDDTTYANTCTVMDCTLDTTKGTVNDDIGIIVFTNGLTVDGCSFMVDEDDIAIGTVADTTVTDCVFTGSSGVGVGVGAGTQTITGCTFTGMDSAINTDGGAVTLTGSTINNSTGDVYAGGYYTLPSATGGAIHVENLSGNFIMSTNTISNTASDEYAVVVVDEADMVFINYNSITGNAKNILNSDGAAGVNASNNYWGDAAGPAAGSVSGTVDTTSPLGAAVASAKVSPGVESLNTKTTVGVVVSGATGASVIGVAKYAANPQASLTDAESFYDAYVCGTTADTVLVKIYDGDENSTLYLWSTETDIWVPQDAAYSVYGGYVYADIDADLLGGTALAVVTGPPPALSAPTIISPETGATDASIRPTFAWTEVAGAAAYYFELSDNPNFVLPLVQLTGDLGRLIVPFYGHMMDLDYSTAYYWRVKAVKGTEDAGDLEQSNWVTSVFVTEDEPVEPEPPIVIEDTPAPIIQPVVEVVTPPETPITPAWIYAIIGVGAVLVIAVIVLIVRTRRVA